MSKDIMDGNNTKILPCTCTHAYQDKKYGRGNRVHNKIKTGAGWRCTVCGKSK